MEQARIEHAPNGSLLTYITIADAMVNQGGHQEDPNIEMAIQMGQHRVWQSISYASLKSGLQEVPGYPQKEKLLSYPTNADRIF